MKRNNNMKKERTIMIVSSLFVLAALTMTGIYMREKNVVQEEQQPYEMDFALEKEKENIAEKQEIVNQENAETIDFAKQPVQNSEIIEQSQWIEEELDYMPIELEEEIELLEDINANAKDALVEYDDDDDLEEDKEEEKDSEKEEKQTATENVIVSRHLAYSQESGLLRPVSGEILMPYSMEASIYFQTLDQYKYNPAVIFSAQQGALVTACAEGKVIDIFEDEEIGNAVTLDLGNGYEVTYGQLQNINVALDNYVNAGEVIGEVSAPTKYYSLEGSNLYFEMTKDGAAINPETLF